MPSTISLKTVLATCSILSLAPQALAHMEMSWPYPLHSKFDPTNSYTVIDYSMTAPLVTDGSNFPCKGYQNDRPIVNKATYQAGQTYNMTIAGSASHGGGSCQLSLSYDNGATFRVIKSMIGGCPLVSKYDFTIPSYAPDGNALFAWTWQNLQGNREMYMNCAEVEIVGTTSAKRDDTSFDDLPFIYKANLDGVNTCVTVENQVPVYPDPGPDVIYGSGASSSSAATSESGVCDAATPFGKTYQNLGDSANPMTETSGTVAASTVASSSVSSSRATTTLVTSSKPTTTSSSSISAAATSKSSTLSSSSSTSTLSTSIRSSSSSSSSSTSTKSSSISSSKVSTAAQSSSLTTSIKSSSSSSSKVSTTAQLSSLTASTKSSTTVSSKVSTTAQPSSLTTSTKSSSSSSSLTTSTKPATTSSSKVSTSQSSSPSSSSKASSAVASSSTVVTYSSVGAGRLDPTAAETCPPDVTITVYVDASTTSTGKVTSSSPSSTISSSTTVSPSLTGSSVSTVLGFSTTGSSTVLVVSAPSSSTNTASTTTKVATSSASPSAGPEVTEETYATNDLATYLPCVPGTFICTTNTTWVTCDQTMYSDGSTAWVYEDSRSVGTGMACYPNLSPYSSSTDQYAQQADAPTGYYRDDRITRSQPYGPCSVDGALSCNGPNMFFLCDNGGLVDMGAVAAGTTCANDEVVESS